LFISSFLWKYAQNNIATGFFLPENLHRKKNIHIFAPSVPTKPLNDAQMRGAFLYYTLMDRLQHFLKQYLTETELVALLKNRGLIISEEAKAIRYLESIGYYRLSAYMFPFLMLPKEEHQYKEGTTFKQIINLYRFDKKLRMLLLNEIEKVEIALRRAIMNIPVQMTGDMYWLTNPVHFANQRTFQDTKATIDREYAKSTEDFIQHFKHSYCEPYPPAWILGELLTMGNVNMIYRNLKADRIRKRISQYFGLQPIVLESWITALTLLRNACCHHSRVWNKVSSIMPVSPRRIAHPWICLPTNPQRVYYTICIIKYFLDIISPNNDLNAKMKTLFSTFPEINLSAMGFPSEWEIEPLWR
jgi:abortive infection bacteriophage resistance protein